jgi:hypothetical protein
MSPNSSLSADKLSRAAKLIAMRQEWSGCRPDSRQDMRHDE